MALINYVKTLWDRNTKFNPTRMNNIENGIKSACDLADTLSADRLVSGNVIVILKVSEESVNGIYYSNSFYVPVPDKDISFNNVSVFGSSGDFKDYFTINNSGNYVYLTTSNGNISNKTIVINITFE